MIKDIYGKAGFKMDLSKGPDNSVEYTPPTPTVQDKSVSVEQLDAKYLITKNESAPKVPATYAEAEQQLTVARLEEKLGRRKEGALTVGELEGMRNHLREKETNANADAFERALSRNGTN